MVVPAIQRPTWAKTGSWRRYIKTSSNRKLNSSIRDMDTNIDEQRKTVRFIQDQVDPDHTRNSSSHQQSEEIDVASCPVDEMDGSESTACSTSVEDKEKENRRRWYSKADFEAFEKDSQLTALQYRAIRRKGAPFIEREHSVRGIEDLLEMDDSRRNNIQAPPNRVEHMRHLLDEQVRQKAAGKYPNDTMLREISTKSSLESRNKAAAMGEADSLSGYVSSKRDVMQRQVKGVMHSLSRKMKSK